MVSLCASERRNLRNILMSLFTEDLWMCTGVQFLSRDDTLSALTMASQVVGLTMCDTLK